MMDPVAAQDQLEASAATIANMAATLVGALPRQAVADHRRGHGEVDPLNGHALLPVARQQAARHGEATADPCGQTAGAANAHAAGLIDFGSTIRRSSLQALEK